MSRYCRTVDPRFLEQLNKKKPQTMAALADIWYASHGAGNPRRPPGQHIAPGSSQNVQPPRPQQGHVPHHHLAADAALPGQSR